MTQHAYDCLCPACLAADIASPAPGKAPREMRNAALALEVRRLRDLEHDVRGLLHEAARTPCTEPSRPHGAVCARLCESWQKKLREALGG